MNKMSSITMENSFVSTNKDMGSNHVVAHQDQHQYLQKNEPTIETLTDNSEKEKSTDLALKMAQKAGVRTPKEWIKYNNKIRKSRRKNSYFEYFLSTTSNFTKAKQRALDNSKNPKSTRTRIAQELHATIENFGLPIDGSLYYISNVDEYEKRNKQELQKYRKFEATTFRRFYNSPAFKSLSPQCFRAEIHYDENGALHLQTQNTWFHQDSRGRVSYAKRAIIKQILQKWYGGEEQLQNRLDVLAEFDNSTEKKIGNKRADAKFYDYISKWPDGQVADDEKGIKSDGSKYKYKHTKAERDTRLVELWRIEQMHTLGEIATKTAKEMNIDYHVSKNYETDDIHRTAVDYVKHRQDQHQTRQTASQLAHDAQLTLKAQQAISDAYTTLTGKDGNSISPLDAAKAITKKTKLVTKEVTENNAKIKKQQEQLIQQEQQLKDQRQQLQNIKQQNENERNEVDKLKKQKQTLEDQLDILQKRLKSAGSIISIWIKKHWDKLEKHFKEYAKVEQQSLSERLHGGPNGTGDIYNAKKYEKRAKDGLFNGLASVEQEERQKLGIKVEISTSQPTISPRQNKEDKTPE